MRKILLVTLYVSSLAPLYGQVDLSKKITLNIENVSLEKFFELLETQHGILVAFGLDNIPLDLRVTIKVVDRQLYEILQLICAQANLTYHIIDKAIVFKYVKPKLKAISPTVAKDSISLQGSIEQDSLPIPSNDREANLFSNPVQDNDSIKNDPSPESVPNELVTTSTEKKVLSQLEPLPLPSLFSPAKKQSKLSLYGGGIFFSYAVDFNQFNYLERDNAFQEYSTDWNQSFSLGGYAIISPKLYISLGLGYATKDFTLNYNYKVLDPDDPFPIPYQTHNEARYLEIPLTVGYGIFNRGKYSLCLALGFYPSFLLEKSEVTSYLNKGNPATEYFVNANRTTLYSASLGFIAHYALTKRCGIFIEPGYLYFTGSVNKEAMHSSSSLYRIKSGLQFSLHSKK